MTRIKTQYVGQWIDVTRSKQFTFDGTVVTGLHGDSVTSALLANDIWLQSRSFKYHRPRGPLTLCGQDANTLVQTPNTPNVLADRLEVEEDLRVSAQHYTGWLRFDLSRLLDWFGRFLPVGFYYKAFFKPSGSWRWWEPLVRSAAGLGVSSQAAKKLKNTWESVFAGSLVCILDVFSLFLFSFLLVTALVTYWD